MNLSHDDLQTLVQFSNLLTLLSTPDKIQTAVASATKVLDESKALLGPAATVEGANAYKAKIEKEAAELLRSLSNERHEFEAVKKKFEESMAAKVQAMVDRELRASNKETSLVDWETDIKRRQQVLEADEAKSFKLAERIEQRAKSLVEQEAAFAEKEAQLKKILG